MALKEQLVGDARPILLLLFAAVGCVLLIACANVGGLLAGRAISRRQELAIRAALGASRGRLLRQCLTESLVLAAMGAFVGLGAAWWGIDAIVGLWPDQTIGLDRVAIDRRVLGFTTLASVLVAIAFGLGPALSAASSPLDVSPGQGNARTTEGLTARKIRGVLVASQVALALMLLIGAGLMIRTVRHLSGVNPGFDPSGMLTAVIDLPSARYPEGYQQVAFFEALVERVRQLPAVSDAGVFNFLPLTGLAPATSFAVVGIPPPPAAERPVADVRIVDEGAFGAMGINVRQGRGVRREDTADTPLVVVVNESLARQFWPAGDAIGHRLRVNWDTGDEAEIVGVVGDVHHFGLDVAVRPMVFFAQRQSPFDLMTLVVRTAGDPGALASAVRGAVRELDRDLAIQRVRPMDAIVAQSMTERRFSMVMLTAFSALALLLTAIGMYGLLASLVGQRLREIGIRIALGAERRDVLRLVVGRALGLTAAGVAIGTAGALTGTRLLASMLYGVTATDPMTFATLPLVLTGVAALATWLPARRALRVDPAVVLRNE